MSEKAEFVVFIQIDAVLVLYDILHCDDELDELHDVFDADDETDDDEGHFDEEIAALVYVQDIDDIDANEDLGEDKHVILINMTYFDDEVDDIEKRTVACMQHEEFTDEYE